MTAVSVKKKANAVEDRFLNDGSNEKQSSQSPNLYELFINSLPDFYELFFTIDLMAEMSETIRTKKAETVEQFERDRELTFFYFPAAFLMLGGFFAPILGIIFFIVHSFFVDDRIFSQTGSILIFISIPMLLAGSHFLDKFDEKKRASQEKEDAAEEI